MATELTATAGRECPEHLLEVVDRAGAVRERLALTPGVATLGRSYRNDIVVDELRFENEVGVMSLLSALLHPGYRARPHQHRDDRRSEHALQGS